MSIFTPFVDRENLHSARSNRKVTFETGPPRANKLTQSANSGLTFAGARPRKPLRDVVNKTDHIRRKNKEDGDANWQDLYSTTPNVAPRMNLAQELAKEKLDADKRYPSIEIMPSNDDDLPDDYEDIWPKEERLSSEELEKLIKWQPYGNDSLFSSMYDEDEEYKNQDEEIDPMDLAVDPNAGVSPAYDDDYVDFSDEPPLFEFTLIDIDW